MKQDAKKTEIAKQSVFSAFKLVIVEWFLSSTAHALPNIFRTSNIALKVIWLLCFLASGSYCIVSIVKSLEDFLSYPVFISTTMVQEIPTQFPAITVCNLKTINKATSKEYFNSTLNFGFTAPNISMHPYRNVLSLQYLTRSTVSNDLNLTNSQKRLLGYELKDMFLSCFFNYETCTTDDFVYSYNPLYGNCYTFNKGSDQDGNKIPVKTVSLAGKLYGLTFEVFVGEPEKETFMEYADGLVVSVHNQSVEPFTDDVLVNAATNADTDIIISRYFMSKLPSPYSDCLKNISANSEFSSYPFDYIVRTAGMMYTQNYCFLLCLQKSLLDTCGCANAFISSYNFTKRYCQSPVEIVCLLRKISGSSQINKDCKIACPFECDSVKYETLSHRSFYPTKYYKKILSYYPLINNSGIKFDDIGEAVAKINVYYKNMLSTVTEENIQTTTEVFFSNVGGTLGLYLGISMLSIVEIVELAFHLVIAGLSFSKKVKPKHDASDTTEKIA